MKHIRIMSDDELLVQMDVLHDQLSEYARAGMDESGVLISLVFVRDEITRRMFNSVRYCSQMAERNQG